MDLTPRNPHFKQMILDKLQGQHFMHHIGFHLTEILPGEVHGEMPIEERIKQQTGFVHGGATATFADLVMGFAAYSLVGADQVVFTADLKVSYLNPGVGKQVKAKGWVVKAGAKIIFCEGEIVASDGDTEVLIAKASATMVVVNLSELSK